VPTLTLGDEREINAFLRLDAPEVAARAVPGRGSGRASDKEVFLALRALNDRW
jgi:hypothetical protein